MIEDDEDTNTDDPTATGAVPAERGIGDDDDLEVSSQNLRRGNVAVRGFSPQAAHDAVRAGATATARNPKIPAAHNAIVEQVKKKVDPEGKLSESERNMATLSSVYSYYISKGDVSAADHAAAGLVQHFRREYDFYKNISAIAAGDGNIDGAIQAGLKAYAAVPDGNDAKLVKTADGNIAYQFTDGEGRVLQKGIAPPEKILGWASRGREVSFDDLILRASGTRAAMQKPQTNQAVDIGQMPAAQAATDGKPVGVPKVADRKAAVDALPEAGEGAAPETDIRNIAGQIHLNNDISPDDALKAARDLANPGQTKYKVQPSANGVTIQAGNYQLNLSRNAYSSIVALREQNAKKAAVDTAKQQEVSKRNDAYRAQDEEARRAARERSSGYRGARSTYRSAAPALPVD